MVLFGTPTRYGNPAAQRKQFLDSTGSLWFQGLLANKVYSAFTSTATGHESTLLALGIVFHHWGGIIVPPGYTDPAQFQHGNPYGASDTTTTAPPRPGGSSSMAPLPGPARDRNGRAAQGRPRHCGSRVVTAAGTMNGTG